MGINAETGIESAMEELRVRYTVRKVVSLAGPTIEAPTHWIVMAFADADQTVSVYSSIPPRTIHGLIPKAVLGEAVANRIQASIRPGA